MWKSRRIKEAAKASVLTANTVDQSADRIVENAIFLHQSFDLVVRVHHGRVVLTAEFTSYLGIAVIRQSLAQVHSDLTRYRDCPGVVL